MIVWCRVIPKQTVERRGSLVFCICKGWEASAHSGREGETLTALQAEGATQAPVICSAAERERRSPLERSSVFAGNARSSCSSLCQVVFKIASFPNICFLDSFALDYVWLRLHGINYLAYKRSLPMRKFLVGFFIVLILSGISLAIISCVTDGGTSTSSSQQSQPQKAPAKGGWGSRS